MSFCKDMDRISVLADELLIKILPYVPTKVAVSTSVLSKRWEYLWMWVPKLEYIDHKDFSDNVSVSSLLRYRDFIHKKLPLHRAPVIESLSLGFDYPLFRPEDIKLWIEIAISRCVRELIIHCGPSYGELEPSYSELELSLPSSLYTSESLETLKLEGLHVVVNVPPRVCLPSLKTLKLERVTYWDEDPLGSLLPCCPVLEDLAIAREEGDTLEVLVVIHPSLQRLSLLTEDQCSGLGIVVIDTPSLKYFRVEDIRDSFTYSTKHMPQLEEAEIFVFEGVQQFVKAITSVKRLSVESMYRSGVVFDQLEQLNLIRCDDYWSKLLVRLLKNSPKLRTLNLSLHEGFIQSEPISWSIEQSSIPKCLLKSLETFEFAGYKGNAEERDFLSFIFKHARCLKSSSILS
ncbi:unnamed protein product [Thlaspi arvense]|uniref:FBD domain-containing protein n=1 Tax=Thlaspi arvense TaxID=13288 RepID=A0AAU9SAM0_THLAR|nr:unnamed protein product [Thlaspi arvense]